MNDNNLKNIKIADGIFQDDRKPQKLENKKTSKKPAQKEKNKDKRSGIAALTVP